MNGWILLACLLGVLLSFALLIADARARQRERLLMTRLREGPLYAQIYPLVRFARRRALDRVRVERGRVVFYAMYPPEVIAQFDIPAHRFRPLSAPKVKALMQVLSEDIPSLKDSDKYRLRRYRVLRPSGEWDWAYVYTARSAYKTYMMRLRRYQPIDRM